MRILFAIPHYFRGRDRARHGSQRRDPGPRLRALAACIANLHHVLGERQGCIRIADRTAHPVNDRLRHQVTVLVCTSGQDHLLDRLPLPGELYQQVDCSNEPRFLGYGARKALADRLGDHDYYCYLEDDLQLRDALFFHKLTWFTHHAGNIAALLPNRYEISMQGPFHKVYVDGDLKPEVAGAHQNVDEQPQLTGMFLGREILIRRPLNPHAGCYFLNQDQMHHWSGQEDFLAEEDAFVSSLESAATLGLMRTFRVYKPDPSNASFLEIQHAGASFASLIGGAVRMAGQDAEDAEDTEDATDGDRDPDSPKN
jgi:hypothetical protein